MKVWITKYALTQGIYTASAYDCGDGMIRIAGSKSCHVQYFHGYDWHRDWESAESHANEMRERAIGSALKKIEKLEAMQFRNPDTEAKEPA